MPARSASRAPVHALITGTANERDRRVVLVAAPRFGIVGQSQTISFKVEDEGVRAAPAEVKISRDGELLDRRIVVPGQQVNIQVQIPHAGQNIVEIEAAPIEGELTQVNNRAVVSIDGVRDKLRVLLVSGEPHAGERTWRNLLKSDANVDLVHFTILRPPEKQDGTPINELSLIAFPTRELFQQKINDFQLIIFDRYARQGVLPIIYFDNIAKYVRNGGAVLVAAGPDYAGPTSLWRTPLDAILPAEPSGHVTEAAFRARLTDPGLRHPVTRGLEGSNEDPPHWSRFFRVVDSKTTTGTTVMKGADDQPLLVLSREGEGRVALVLSDQIWLWARGYEGGGPHIDLLRRLSHWLMKQPDLEEEALRLLVHGREITVQRQTMADTVASVIVTSPSGMTQTSHARPGGARRVAQDRRRDRTRPVAGNRRQADDPRQCRPGEPPRIQRGHFDHQRDGAARHRHRRRLAPPGRGLGHGRAAHRRRAFQRHLQRRRLDRPQAARSKRRPRHRRAADVCGSARPPAAGRQPRPYLGARGAIN